MCSVYVKLVSLVVFHDQLYTCQQCLIFVKNANLYFKIFTVNFRVPRVLALSHALFLIVPSSSVFKLRSDEVTCGGLIWVGWQPVEGMCPAGILTGCSYLKRSSTWRDLQGRHWKGILHWRSPANRPWSRRPSIIILPPSARLPYMCCWVTSCPSSGACWHLAAFEPLLWSWEGRRDVSPLRLAYWLMKPAVNVQISISSKSYY